VLSKVDATNYNTHWVNQSGGIADAPSDSKLYARQNAAWVDTGPAYVDTAGDTMTGLLTLSGNPLTALQAAPKQ
jgi:hypothetical protein